MKDFTDKIHEIPDLVNNNGIKPEELNGYIRTFEKMVSGSDVHRSRGERGLVKKGYEPVKLDI